MSPRGRTLRRAGVPVGPIAVDLILQRRDRLLLMKEFIVDPVPEFRAGAFNVLREDRSFLPDVLPLLFESIGRIPVFPDRRKRRISA